MRQLTVIGTGPGAECYMHRAAMDAMAAADCVVAPARHMPLASGHCNTIELRDFESTFNRMEAEAGAVAVLVSGDPGLYSLLPLLKRRFPGVPLHVIPGISSLQSLCAAAGETWQDAAILSGHGRPLSTAKFLNTVERSGLTVLFCGNEWTPRRACELLNDAVGGLGERVRVTAGERLSYPDRG
jgi:precorrin-6Y C5,15-methyltransferase (decarboxylating)